MTVQLPTSWKRRTTLALFRRQFPSHAHKAGHVPVVEQGRTLPRCHRVYADTVRRGGDTRQTLRKRKDLRWITFVGSLFVAPSGPIASLVGL